MSIQWHNAEACRIGLVRVHAGVMGYGSPWRFGCVVKDDGSGIAQVELAPVAPTISEAKAPARELRSQGFKRANWERRNVRHKHVADVK